MLKTGFRGERKRILTPITYSPIQRLLPRRGGNVVTEKGEYGDEKGECSDGEEN